MKRTQVMGGLLAAIAIALCCVGGPGDLLAGKGGKGGSGGGGGSSSGAPETPGNYGIVTIPGLPGTTGGAGPSAINNNGELVGASNWAGTRITPFPWYYSPSTNKMTDLNTLFNQAGLQTPDGGAFGLDSNQTGWNVEHADDINDSGQIICVFAYRNDWTPESYFVVRYTPARSSSTGLDEFDYLEWDTTTFGTPPSFSMNNDGDVVAGVFLWTDAQFDSTAGWLTANLMPHGAGDVNDDDGSGWVQIIGDNRRYTVNVNTLQVTDDFDIGTLPQKNNVTSVTNHEHSINNSGDVAAFNVVTYTGATFPTQNSYRYSDGAGLVDFGSYGSDVSWIGDMNNLGDVVGTYRLKSGEPHLYLYSDTFGTMTDLSVKFPNYVLANGGSGPAGLNDSGQICGWTADTHEVFILTPQ